MAASSTFERCANEQKRPKICGMGVRKLVNEFLVVSPVVLIGCITVQARTMVDPYEPVQISNELHRKIAAYEEPVRLVEQYARLGHGVPDPDRLRKIGLTWRNMTRAGALHPLPPETLEDSTRDGIKGQIRSAAEVLSSKLIFLAQKEAKAGRVLQAAEDATLALEAVQGVKCSDLYALGIMSVRQGVALELIRSCIPALTEEERQNLARRFKNLREAERPLLEIVLAEQRTRLARGETDARAATYARTQLELMLELANAMDSGRSERRMQQLTDELKLELRSAQTTLVETPILPEFRFAWNARKNALQHWSQIELELLGRRA
jgi:hypothetical protein